MFPFTTARMLRITLASIWLAGGVAMSYAGASADTSMPTRVIPVPNAPVVLTRCESAMGMLLMGTDNATNRADVFLSSYTVRWTVYDHGGSMIGQADIENGFNSDLAPGDDTHSNGGALSWTGPASSIGSVTCRLQAAKFEGNKSWLYGRQWQGKLSPIPSSQSMSGGSQSMAGTSSHASSGDVSIDVINGWNDVVNGITYVHDTVSIRGGFTDVTLNPSQFALTMSLANGARKTYYGLTQPAPTYQKLNPLGSTTMTAYEVDPRTDLGSIGSIIVPAHGNVTVTVTFDVPDIIANANDNRTVAIR